MKTVIVSSAFDDMRTADIRFLNEASRLGRLHVLLWSDEVARAINGKAPKFPFAERQYFVDAMRCVAQITTIERAEDAFSRAPSPKVRDVEDREAFASPDHPAVHTAPSVIPDPARSENVLCEGAVLAVRHSEDTPATREAAHKNGMDYVVISDDQLTGFPPLPHELAGLPPSNRKKIIVTGCYDWFHTGHVRFFEEVNDYGDVYVGVGNDANLQLLKGPGHPQFPEDERRYVVASTRFVRQAMITTGSGWMDAEPEIERIKPDIYAVNEDGDKPQKQEFCRQHGLEYLVLKRLPKAGLTRRSSTDLRGF